VPRRGRFGGQEVARIEAMTPEQAVLYLRRRPECRRLLRDAYLEEDVPACAERFLHSAEFEEIKRLIGNVRGTVILDLGAGTGIASYAFAESGARLVYALEPDSSSVVGHGAMRSLTRGMPVRCIQAVGEAIPLRDAEVDVVYARQMLHHAADVSAVLRESARVLKAGGVFFASRDHVADNGAQLRAFLDGHPLHRLTGSEYAYPLRVYLEAIRSAPLVLESALGPWDTIINAFPFVTSTAQLDEFPSEWLRWRLGFLGGWASSLAPMRALVRAWLNRSRAGRTYSFVARKLRTA
jgi:SAM-dependent methyltransferase